MGLEISDELLATFVPIVVYWAYSGIYLLFGSCDNYRLHSRKDEDEKNLVSKGTVFRGVLLQHAIHASIGMITYAVTGGNKSSLPTTTNNTPQKLSMILLPIVQFLTAMLVFDTWSYFMHRYMHHNKFLYQHVHSYHHRFRLVVPYSFGAAYSHPLEAILLDSVGGVLAFLISGMSPRVSMLFFSFGSIKSVDDHCGLMLPGNVLQLLFKNNTVYHDVHHQLYGSKYNFSQPFFVMWDHILGTYQPYSLEKRVDGGFKVLPVKGLKDE